MVKPKKKVNFKKIFELIQAFDATAGLFLFKNTNSKKTCKEKLLGSTWLLNAVLSTLLIVSTLVVTEFKLINVIICSSILILLTTNYVILVKLFWKKDTVKKLLKWCEDLYDSEKKYHVLVRPVADVYLLKMESRTLKILKWIRILIYTDVFAMSLGFAFVGLFLPENMHPKFSPPLPLYLPFKHQDTWLTFVVTTVTQTLCLILNGSFALLYMCIFCCITLHVLGSLDMIKQTITERLKQEMIMKCVASYGDKEQKPSTSKLQVSVLIAINQTTAAVDKRDETTFNEWMSILTEMISDVNGITTVFSKFFTEMFLLYEMACLGSLFICGLIFIVLRQQYFFAVGILMITSILFAFCYINEKILEKFEDIEYALYDLPWWDLTPKEQKALMIVMNCGWLQKGFTAAGIHDLTLERFRIIVNAGYTNLLVLKDLVMK